MTTLFRKELDQIEIRGPENDHAIKVDVFTWVVSNGLNSTLIVRVLLAFYLISHEQMVKLAVIVVDGIEVVECEVIEQVCGGVDVGGG